MFTVGRSQGLDYAEFESPAILLDNENQAIVFTSVAQGPPGPQGPQGPQGVPGTGGGGGTGLPPGGIPGQIIVKTGVADGDASWETLCFDGGGA